MYHGKTCNHCSTSSLISDVGFQIPNRFVVGYALDYNEHFRDLNVRSSLFSYRAQTAIQASNKGSFVLNIMFCFLITDLFQLFVFFAAYLCDQRKWEDKIQGLTEPDHKRGDCHTGAM